MLTTWMPSSFALARLYVFPASSETAGDPAPPRPAEELCTARTTQLPLNVAFGKRTVYPLTEFAWELGVLTTCTRVGVVDIERDCVIADTALDGPLSFPAASKALTI